MGKDGIIFLSNLEGIRLIYTVTLNPALDKTVEIDDFAVNTVNRIRTMRTDPGGKGINVSKVIQSLGGQSTALGILAGSAGQMIREMLENMGLSCDFTYVNGQTRTNLKIVDSLRHTNTDINEPGPSVSGEVLEKLLSDLTAKLLPGDIVVLSGSVPANAAKTLYRDWTQACQEKGARVFLDADGALLEQGLLGIPYLVKPNQDELSRLLKQPLDTMESLIAAGQQLQAQGICWVVISLGAEGAIFLHGNRIYRAQGISVPVGSTVGAGDSMVAALALGCEQEMDDIQIIRLAMATSAANVMCSGSQPASKADVVRLLEKAVVTEYKKDV